MRSARIIGRIVCALTLGAAAPALAQDDEGFTQRAQDLANCAGAVAAAHGLNAADHYPGFAAQAPSAGWPAILATIQSELSRERGLEGATGLAAAQASRAYWAGRRARVAEAEACRTQFAPHIEP